MELDFFSLECNEVSSSMFWGVCGFGVFWAAWILMLRAVFLLCWRISMVCLALELVGSWVELGFNVGTEAFGWALIDYWSLESGVLWYSQVWGLRLLPLVFSLILIVAWRILHPYCTNDKTSSLMVKRFSTLRYTKRVSRVTWRREEGGGR